MTLTLLWYALADQSNPAGYEANAVDKRARTSDDDPEHCLQVTRFAHFLFYVSESLNYLCHNNTIILPCISNLAYLEFRKVKLYCAVQSDCK